MWMGDGHGCPECGTIDEGISRETTYVCDFCGNLDWTLRGYGEILHKHNCPQRRTRNCQQHPGGCPTIKFDI